jgi:dynein heavy chain
MEPGEVGIQEIIKDLYSEKNVQQTNKIQDALFYTPEVIKQVLALQSGEEAIQFFAKYGNSTPIKYVNCTRKETSKEVFRPYDLDV